MSNPIRLALIGAVVVLAVVAFVVLRPGDDGTDSASQTTTGTATEEVAPPPAPSTQSEQTQTQPSPPPAPEPPPPPPPPAFERIETRNGAPVGNPPEIQATRGETVRFQVTSNREEEVHLHGYDVLETAAPGRPARFVLKADIEGIFEVTMHTPDGAHSTVATLRVEP